MAIFCDYAGYITSFGISGNSVGPSMGSYKTYKVSDRFTLTTHSNTGGTYTTSSGGS